MSPERQGIGVAIGRGGYARGATQTPDSPSSRITDDQLQTWGMEYGSVKAAAEIHPEIEYELRLRDQEQGQPIQDRAADAPEEIFRAWIF